MTVTMLILTILALLVPAVGHDRPATTVAQDSTAAPFTIQGASVTGIAIEPVSDEGRYVAAESTLYRVDEHGAWVASGISPGLAAMVVDTRNPNVVWAGTGEECYRGGGDAVPMKMSTDGGATWSEAAPVGFVPLASWIDLDVVIAHDCRGLQISHDGGASWAMPDGLPLGSQITAFTVASSPESAEGLSVLVGVTGEGGTSQLHRVSLSAPEAMTVDGPLQTYYAIGSLVVVDDGAILLGAPQGVLRSDDRGKTWTRLRAGLETTTLEQDPIEAFPADLEPGTFGLRTMVAFDDAVYVSGVDGVYRLDADDQMWQRVVVLAGDVRAMAVEPGTGTLLLVTREGDVLRAETQAGS